MQYRAALAAALLPVAFGFQVTISSNCDYDVYGWNVVDNYGSGTPTFTLNAGSAGSWSGPFESKGGGGGGPSIKLQKADSLFINAEQTQVEYYMDGPTLFYDLSDVNGHPFSGSEIIMQTSNPSCPTVQCAADEAVCSQAYQTPDDLRTLACDGGADIQVMLCGSGSSSGSTGSSAAAPAPPTPTTMSTATTPSTAPAPPAPTQQQQGGGFLQEDPSGDVEVVVATKVVTVSSAVHMPQPTGDTESKREADAEAHLLAHLHRGHSRVMGRHAH
jgi:hypothetical protein